MLAWSEVECSNGISSFVRRDEIIGWGYKGIFVNWSYPW